MYIGKENISELLQERLYKGYVKSIGIGEEVFEVKEEREPSEEGQVRLFLMMPPEYVCVMRKEGDLSVIVPLTSYLQLAITDRYPPLIRWGGFRLVPLPFWVYANEKITQKYSVPLFKIESKSLEEIRIYVKEARTKGIGEWREKFIKKVAQRFKDINISSLVYEVIKAEEGR